MAFVILWLVQASCIVLVMAQVAREYNMDEFATCGRTLNIDDSGIRLIGGGNAAPSNPPLECIVYLQSVYALDDGTNKLQIKVEALDIRDCNVKVDLYNGRSSVGQTLYIMSCKSSSTGLIYSTGRAVTVKLSRPDHITFNGYQFSLEIKPFKTTIAGDAGDAICPSLCALAPNGCHSLCALTPNECKAALNVCQADLWQSLNAVNQTAAICANARSSSIPCVQKLSCDSEMYLRIAIRVVELRLKERGNIKCELGLYFPKDKDVSIDCQQKKKSCMNPYIDLQLQHETNTPATSLLCQDLNAYNSCMLKNNSCWAKEEMVNFSNTEKSRLAISNCNIDAFNNGAQMTYNVIVMCSAMLIVALPWSRQ